MNKLNRININIKSEGRIFVFLSSLLLCICLTACGSDDMIFVEAKEYETGNERNVENLERNMDSSDDDMDTNDNNSADIEEDESQEKCVYVCGAVNNEIVYSFTNEKRVCDAIEAAGGFAQDACKNAVNMSAKLVDEQKIYVPTYYEVKESIWNESTASFDEDPRVDINTADIQKLVTLKGIGETRAQAIIEYRQEHGRFEKTEDIMKVSGIGKSSFEKIKDDIRVE